MLPRRDPFGRPLPASTQLAATASLLRAGFLTRARARLAGAHLSVETAGDPRGSRINLAAVAPMRAR
jgi:hypothetical protein